MCCPLGLLDNNESVTANNVTGSTQTIRVKEKVAGGREREGGGGNDKREGNRSCKRKQERRIIET